MGSSIDWTDDDSSVLLKYAPGDTIPGETFSRATAARQNSSAGVVTSAAINVKRDSHYINGVRSTLLEWLSINLCLQSENFGTTWTAVGTPTRSAGAHTAAGISLDLLGDDSAASTELYLQPIAFTGNATKAVSIYMKEGTSPHAGGSLVRVVDTTAPVTRLEATVTWVAAVPSVAMTFGTYLGYEGPLAGGVYRLLFVTDLVAAANSHQVEVRPTDGVVASIGNVYAGGVQLENLPFPTSYIPTETLPVTRNADVYSLPPVPSQELTAYFKFVELGTLSTGATTGLWVVGTTTALFIYGLGVYSITHRLPGSTDRTSSLAVAPAFGTVNELKGNLFGDGSVQIGQSIAGATETVAARSAAAIIASAWNAATSLLNDRGTGPGCVAIQSFKIAAGARSLEEMRAIATPLSFSNGKAVPMDRFANWTPMSKPVGPAETALGTGRRYVFPFRTDHTVSFEVRGVPNSQLWKMLKLQDYLLRGGLVSINTGDSLNSVYSTCCLAPDSVPQIAMTDARELEYSFSVTLLNVAGAPFRMLAVY